jgi:hypothetical protein
MLLLSLLIRVAQTNERWTSLECFTCTELPRKVLSPVCAMDELTLSVGGALASKLFTPRVVLYTAVVFVIVTRLVLAVLSLGTGTLLFISSSLLLLFALPPSRMACRSMSFSLIVSQCIFTCGRQPFARPWML